MLIQWTKRTVIATLVVFSSLSAQTEATEALGVKLQTIEKIRSQEKSGDELVINITEFPTEERPIFYQLPTYPAHWLSKYLPNVKNITLWKKELNQCEPIDLLISLVEKDFPPWDPDDLLGSVELKVKCVNGNPVEEWIIPDPKITTVIKTQKNAFSFMGRNAEYHAVFELENEIKK